MKIYQSFRNGFDYIKVGTLTYYAVFLGISLFFSLLGAGSLLFSYQDGTHTYYITMVNGLSAVTAICAFALGCAFFKRQFALGLQNGVSRRSQFLGWLCTAGAGALLMALLDQLLVLLFTLLGKLLEKLPFLNLESLSLLETIYGPQGNLAVTSLYAVAFSFFLLLAAFSAGHFIGVLFYRLPAAGKIALLVGCGALPLIVIPALKMIRDYFHLEALYAAAVQAFTHFLYLAFGGAPNCMVSCLAIVALFSLFSWLLARRAVLKK